MIQWSDWSNVFYPRYFVISALISIQQRVSSSSLKTEVKIEGEKEESEEWLHESWSTRHHHQVEELHDSIVHGTQVNRILMTKQYQPAVIEWTPTVMH